ncbi:zinc finger BED domain-containing protein DAYSLEEPER-like [Rhizophagus clarus]|uniref:Zinc finger BED domain-containing protein DAYSLEEPER-like n=1 Tax=Rhizophagus clarus TaxID=94130 RepID=A0A8H3LUK9_9GLOM|nr:zinc finger BED domain-containing protein DAYSLEEPER-like [Rhizophagus clarus]
MAGCENNSPIIPIIEHENNISLSSGKKTSEVYQYFKLKSSRWYSQREREQEKIGDMDKFVVSDGKKESETSGQVSFTVDAWTSRNQIPFLGISIHWINNNWELKYDFRIANKILVVVCDNASNMNVMLENVSQTLAIRNIKFDPENQRALHNTVSADKELRKYLLSEEEWICISDIHEILQYYKKCTELSIGQQYPILSCSIPVYNLLDKLKNEYDKRKNSEENEKDDEDDDEENDKMVKRDKIAIALNQSIEKVKQYYASTGGKIEETDELNVYLNEAIVSEKTDILAWWKVD